MQKLLFTMFFVAISFSAFTQNSKSDESLMTVEEAYLNSI